MAHTIAISARALRAQGLNLDGVQLDGRGRVPLTVADDAVDVSRLARNKGVRKDILAAIAEFRQQKEAEPDDSGDLKRITGRLVEPAVRDLGLPEAFAGQLAQLAEEEAAAERRARAAAALAVMSRTAVIRHRGAVYLASTHDPSQPEIVAQASSEDTEEVGLGDTLVTIAEITFELLTGLLALLGVTLRARIPVGKFVERILDIIRRNRRVRRAALRVLYGGKGKKVTAFDLLTFLKELFFYGFTWECVKESLDEIVDLSFWGLIRLVFKIQTRLTPGVGQAILLADLALIAVEIGIKIARHFRAL